MLFHAPTLHTEPLLKSMKKKGMYTKRCKFSATQTAIFCHSSKNIPSILQCGGIKFLNPEEFSFKAMSPTHKYTQPSCRSVNRALRDRQARYPGILPSEFDQISSANTRMPNACRNRHTGKLLNPQLLPLPSLSAPPNDIVSFLISQPRFPFQSCVCVPPVAAAAAGWP